MKSKKRPTRDDLAAAFRAIRDQYHRTYAQHLNHWGTAEGVNPLGPLEIL